jgi:flavorubredoxin
MNDKQSNKLNDANPIEIAPGIWWVGFADFEAGFSNNPYLLVDGDEAILFDPGPAHPLFRDLILQKIEQIIDPGRIKYLVVHHQDPDLCGLLPFIENMVHPDAVVMTHPRASLFIPYYGLRKGILPLCDGDTLRMKSGRRITFYHAPYLHFAGNIMSHDEETGSLFSSDIFAVFNREWNLYADDTYIDLAKSFIEHYVASKEPVLYAYEKIKNLDVKRILPQHGGIIEDNVDKFLEMLTEVRPGKLLEELTKKPSDSQTQHLFRTGKDWLEHWLKKEVNADSLNELLDVAMQEGPSTISILVDNVTETAKELGVANPLTYSQEHAWDNIWSVKSTQIVDSVRRRYLSRQYGITYGTDSNLAEVTQHGLMAVKTMAAVVFIDIREFTKWSADRSPHEIVLMLNREYEIISRLIHAGGGRINKLMGDGILAYFPENRLSDCLDSVLKIKKAIPENGLLPAGIGIDFGEVIMGDLGQEVRLDYTLIGAVVNFAARMCSSAGEGEIAVSRRMFERLSKEKKDQLNREHSPKKCLIRIKPSDPETEGLLLS